MRFFFPVLYAIFSFFAWSAFYPTPLSAHAGSGPPFLRINNQLANTNPYSSAMQDLAPQKYSSGQSLHFAIDLHALNIPQSIADTTQFRWKFSTDDLKYEYGSEVSHTYTIPKTYLVTVEVLPPQTQTYIPLDVVQINVLPNHPYTLPNDVISITIDSLTSTSPIHFLSSTKLDPSAKSITYFWDFGDGDSSREKNPTHVYQGTDFAYLVSLKLTDSNKFVAYTGLIAGSNNGKLYFENPYNKKKKIAVNTGLADRLLPRSLQPLLMIVIGIVILTVTLSIKKYIHKK